MRTEGDGKTPLHYATAQITLAAKWEILKEARAAANIAGFTEEQPRSGNPE